MRALAVLLAVLWSFPALAGYTLVPTPPLVGDGTTVATVRLYSDAPAARLKIKSDDGKVGPTVPSDDGLLTFPFTPDRVTAAGVAKLTLTADGATETIEIPVVPPFTGSLTVSFDPPVLASTGSATVKITADLGTAVATERRRFLLSASLGTVDAPVPSGSGTWVARYTPPKGLTQPTNVIFAAADASSPDTVAGHAVLPVTVRRSVSFDAPVGSSSILAVGDRSYGPFPAAPSGKVAFDVDVDPRFLTGKLTTVAADGAKTDKDVEIPGAGAPHLGFLSVGPVVPAKGTALVRVYLLDAGGRERTDADMKLSASAGTVSEAKYKDGAYEATYTASGNSPDVTIVAEANGARAERKLRVVTGAGSVTLVADPEEIPTGAKTVKFVARVKDATGTAVTGAPPVIEIAEGGTLYRTLVDNRDGSYTGTINLKSGANLVRVAAVPQLAPTGAGPRRLVAWLSSPLVGASGTDTTTLTVLALDPYGLPVPNIELKLGVPKGDGSLPPTASIGASGVARVTYKAGTTPGLGGIRVEGAGLVTEVPVWQSKDGRGPTLPVAGPPDVEAALAVWQAATPQLAVVRAGTAPLSGPPAAVVVSTVPPYTTPGAAILVNVRVLDAAGKGVPGQKLALSASPGTVGAITDNRDGTYALPVQLPAGVDGPLTITAGAGSATGSIVLPTLANAAVAQASAPAGGSGAKTNAGGGGGGGGGGKTGGGKAGGGGGGTTASDMARLRVGAMLTNAHGSFNQSGNGGAQILGEAGYATPAAGFFGVTVDALFYPVNASFGAIGIDARGHTQLEMFKVFDKAYVYPQRDLMAGVQYRRPMGSLSAFGGLGVHYTSGVVFRYSDATLSDARLLDLPVVGARLGAGLMLEAGKSFGRLEVAETFAPFPVDTHAELLYEYSLAAIALRAGLAWDYRTMKFATEGGDGEARVKQNQVSVLLGTGFKF